MPSSKTFTIAAAGLALAASAMAGPSLATAAPAAAPVAATGAGLASSALAVPAHRHHHPTPVARLNLTPSNAALAACFPHARANVRVKLTTDKRGKDTFTIYASGLRPKTAFTVFLLEKATPKFGAAEYIGDFTTNKWGRGHGSFKLIVEEAFAFNGETGARTDLNSVGFWFADPKDDDDCLGANSPVTPFDGDAEAGVQMMNSGAQLLP